ncbi:MAG TPA: CHASE domain-containing protein, partial [Syntrophorhabdales bacterium]|nr:CHASE domain-containing protein [Syntrophorhabdales bacterium]
MRRNYLLIALIIVVGVSLSVTAFLVLRNWEHKKAEMSLENIANYRHQTLAKELQLDLAAVESLKALYTGVPEVTRSEFGAFAKYLLSMHPSIQALEWITRVADEQRTAYEERAKKGGFPAFQITERDVRGKIERAATRGEYFPVYFVEPYRGNEAALGFDLASNEARKLAMETARDTGTMAATERIKLVQEKADQYGFLLFVPIYRKGAPTNTFEERRKNLRGFVLGVFRIGDIMEKAVAPTPPIGMPFTVYEATGTSKPAFLYHHLSRRLKLLHPSVTGDQSASDPRFHYTRLMNVANREWLVVYTVDRDHPLLGGSWQPWAAFLVGLLLTGVAVTYALLIMRHIRSLSTINARLSSEVDERRRAEEAFKKSEATLRSVFSASPVGFALLGFDRTIEWVSDGMTALNGYTVDDAKTRDLRELYETTEEYLRVGPIIYGAVRDGTIADVETRWVHKDGRVLDIRLRAAAIDPKDPSSRIVFTASDITSAKRAAMALRESEGRYRALFDDSPVALVELDGSEVRTTIATLRASGVTNMPKYLGDHPAEARELLSLLRILHLNRAALELFEAPDDGNYGSGLERLIAHMPSKVVTEVIPFIEEMEGRMERESESVTTKGSRIHLASRWAVEPGYKETHGRILVSFMDITKRKEMEDALRTSQIQLRDAADLAHLAYWEADPATREFTFNDAFYALFDTTAEREGGYRMAIAEYSARFVYPDDLVGYRRHLEEIFASQRDFLQFEHRTVRRDGQVRHILNRARFVRDGAGQIIKIYGAKQDITERKEAEEMLQRLLSEREAKNRELEAAYADLKNSHRQILQQEKMASIGVLAAGVAHEINNPMGFIISNLNSLRKYTTRLHEYLAVQSEAIERLSQHGNGANEPVLAHVEGARRSLKIDYVLDDSESLLTESLEGADRVKRIVQDLKSFSRVDGTEIVPTDINQVLDSTINIVWNELKHKATLKKEYGKLPLVPANHGQLSQVFMNILVNAAQAIQDH